MRIRGESAAFVQHVADVCAVNSLLELSCLSSHISELFASFGKEKELESSRWQLEVVSVVKRV